MSDSCFDTPMASPDYRAARAALPATLVHIRKLAYHFHRTQPQPFIPIEVEDLISVGNLAAIRALDTYKMHEGRFETYAVEKAKFYLRNYYRDHGYGMARQWFRHQDDLARRARKANAPPKPFEEVPEALTTPISFQQVPPDREGYTLADRIRDPYLDIEADVVERVAFEQLRASFSQLLTRQEALLLEAHWLEGLGERKLAERYRIGLSAIRKDLKTGLQKLQQYWQKTTREVTL